MPIRTLEIHPDSAPLDAIKNAVIGIDVSHYIKSIMNTTFDSNFEGIGGFPVSLENRILQDVSVFEKFGIKPIYVFPGIKTPQQLNFVNKKDLPHEKTLTKYWETKANNPNLSARDSSNPFLLNQLLDQLTIILQRNELEYLISPYVQHHQLYYMMKEGIIDCIYASNDALLIKEIDNFIVGIDFSSERFHYMNISQFLHESNLDFRLFVDISMCLGNVYQPATLLEKQNINFVGLLQLATMSNKFDGYSYIVENSHNQTEPKSFKCGMTLLEFCPVLKVNGRIEPIDFAGSDSLLKDKDAAIQKESTIKSKTDKQLPEMLTDVFGFHMSEELYFYQSIGLPVLKYIEAFQINGFHERLSTDLTKSPVFDKLLCGNTSMKKREYLFDLFTKSLHRYFQHQKLHLQVTNVSDQRYSIEFMSTVTDEFKDLMVRHATAKSFDLPTFINQLNDDYLFESNFKYTPGGPRFSVASNHELISTAMLRTFINYNFVTFSEQQSKFTMTPWGVALTEYISKYNTDLENTLLLFVFFQRFKDFNIKDLADSSDLNNIQEKVENLGTYNLVAKFASLNRISKFKSENYKGPVSRSLLHFNSTVNLLNTELKDFVTIHLLTLLFDNKSDANKFSRDNETWCELACEVPFKRALPNTIGGLIVQRALQTSVALEEGENFDSKLKDSLTPFTTILENPTQEAKKSLKYVVSVCNIADILGEAKLIDEKVVDTFVDMRAVAEKTLDMF